MSKENERIEVDLASGSAKPYGSSRSIVRRIASNLPLQPCPRVHFQLHPYAENSGVLRRQNCQVASLADVSWIDQDEDEEEEGEEEDEDYLGRPRSGIPPGFVFRAQRPHPGRRPLNRRRSLPSLHQGAPDPQGPSKVNDEAIQKIGALETELAKLRIQIAQIVLAQEKSTQPGPPMPPPAPSGTLPPPSPASSSSTTTSPTTFEPPADIFSHRLDKRAQREEDRRGDDFGVEVGRYPQHAGYPEGHQQSQVAISQKSSIRRRW
ncbi:unnamed protein product [Pleuronectes platessa]|uniref:Mitochondrial fission regulator n=1 Tax=Pleuronectes platessa TaxID=8262 RepID=A0A9N7UBG7_PLEPL|nr:unnamed protein product [Pleuronectes platessa]